MSVSVEVIETSLLVAHKTKNKFGQHNQINAYISGYIFLHVSACINFILKNNLKSFHQFFTHC